MAKTNEISFKIPRQPLIEEDVQSCSASNENHELKIISYEKSASDIPGALIPSTIMPKNLMVQSTPYKLNEKNFLRRLENWWNCTSLTRLVLDSILQIKKITGSPEAENHRGRSLFAHSISQGCNLGVFIIWPLIVSFLTIHDFIEYQVHPNNRFNNSLLDQFDGEATNQVSWGGLWGTDLVRDWKCWFGISLALSMPLILAITNYLQNFNLNKDFENYEKILENGHFSFSHFSGNFLINESLNQLRWLIVFHNAVKFEQRLNWIDELISKKLESNVYDIESVNDDHIPQIEGLIYQQIAGKGYRLFQAVSYALKKHVNNSAELDNYLQQIVSEILQAKAKLSLHEKLIENLTGNTVEKYLNDINQGIEHEPQIEIQILMQILGQPIIVINPDGKIANPEYSQNFFQGQPIFIYNNKSIHYDAFLVKRGYSPRQILKNLLTQKSASQENLLPDAQLTTSLIRNNSYSSWGKTFLMIRYIRMAGLLIHDIQRYGIANYLNPKILGSLNLKNGNVQSQILEADEEQPLLYVNKTSSVHLKANPNYQAIQQSSSFENANTIEEQKLQPKGLVSSEENKEDSPKLIAKIQADIQLSSPEALEKLEKSRQLNDEENAEHQKFKNSKNDMNSDNKISSAINNNLNTNNPVSQQSDLANINQYLNDVEEKQRELTQYLIDIANFPITSEMTLNQQKNLYLIKLVSHYYLWSLGQAQHTFWDILFSLCEFLKLNIISFSIYRLGRAFGQKLYDISTYYKDKEACETQHKIYTYMEEYGDYHCSACPGSPYVYYYNADDFQLCLDGLLLYADDPAKIIEYSKKLLKQTKAQTIYLQKQPWYQWSYNQWDQFWSNIPTGVNTTKTLDVSQQQQLLVPPEQDYIERLSEIFGQIAPQRINVANLNLGSELFQTLLQQVNNGGLTQVMNVSGNNLTDDDLLLLLNTFSNLETLIFSNNQLSSNGLSLLAARLPHMPFLRVLKIDDNHFSANGFYDLINALPNSNIEFLDVSSNALNHVEITQINDGLNHSKLTQLYIDNCSLSDLQFQALAPSLPVSLKVLSMENNFCDNDGMQAVGQLISQNTTHLATLFTRYNQFSDTGLLAIAEAASYNAYFSFFDFSFNAISLDGFSQFIQAIINTHIYQISAQGLNLGDAGASIVAQLLNGIFGHSPLGGIDLSSNLISGKGASELFASLKKPVRFSRLVLNNNLIDSDSLQALNMTDSLPLKEFVLSSNPINAKINDKDATNLSNFFKELPQTYIEYLMLDNIQMPDDVAINLAKNLLTATDQQDTLSHKDISIDEARALHHKAKPKTQLKAISLRNTGIGNGAANFFCRSLGPADIAKPAFGLSDNPQITDRNIETCQSSSGVSQRLPQGLLLTAVVCITRDLPIFVGLLAAYVLVCGIYSLFRNQNNTRDRIDKTYMQAKEDQINFKFF